MAGLGSLVISLAADTAKFSSDMGKAVHIAQQSSDRIGRAFGNLRSIAGSLFGGISIGVFVQQLLSSTMEAEQALNRLNAVMKSTGGVAGQTSESIQRLADELMSTTGFDDESILNAAGTLAKFGSIHGKVFEDAIRLSADYAAVAGTDVPAAAQAIGKALDSPTQGLRALEKEFGKLTPAQKEAIDEMVQLGKKAEAQAAVLDILKEKIGGTATEMNTGINKAAKDVKNSWDEMLQAMGRTDTVQAVATQSLKIVEASLVSLRALVEGSGLAFDALMAKAGSPGSIKSRVGKPELLNPDPLSTLGAPGEIGKPGRAISDTERKYAFMTEDQIKEAKAAEEKAAKEIAEIQKRHAKEFLEIRARGMQAIFKDKEEKETKANEDEIAAQKKQDELFANMQKVRADRDQTRREEEIAAEQKLNEVLAAAALERLESVDKRREESVKRLADETKKADEFAKSLGMTFASAAEEAIIKFTNLKSVIAGLLQDIAKLVFRKNVTEPLLSAAGSVFGGLFGGGKSVNAGSVSPEQFDAMWDVPRFATGIGYVPRDMLAMVHRGEEIIPAGQARGGGGVTINFTGGQPIDTEGFLASVVPIMQNLARGEISNQLRVNGVLSR